MNKASAMIGESEKWEPKTNWRCDESTERHRSYIFWKKCSKEGSNSEPQRKWSKIKFCCCTCSCSCNFRPGRMLQSDTKSPGNYSGSDCVGQQALCSATWLFCLQLIGFWFYLASETKSTQYQSCIVTQPCVLSELRGRKHTQSHTSHASAAFGWKRFVYESA